MTLNDLTIPKQNTSCNDLGNFYIDTEVFSSKKKLQTLYIKYYDIFDKQLFYDNIKPLVNEVDQRFSIILRVCFEDEKKDKELITTAWKTLGRQLGFINTGSIEDIYSLHDTVTDRLKVSQDSYGYSFNNIIQLQLLIYSIHNTNKIIKKMGFDVKSLGDSKDLINTSSTVNTINKLLPLTNNTSHFGTLLENYFVENKIIGFIDCDGVPINFIESINKHNPNTLITSFSDNISFFNKLVGDTSYIIIVEPISSSAQEISIYNINGYLIQNVNDNRISDDKFVRKTGNVVTYIGDKGVYNKDIIHKLNEVKADPVKGLQAKMFHPDPLIGTMDLETYDESHDLSKVYAAGFYTEKGCNIFYVDEKLNHDAIIMECFDAMLTSKYNKYSFYIHNLAEFDSIFILPVIDRICDLYPDIYSYSPKFRDDVTIGLEISKRVDKKKFTITLLDSYCMLKSSLSDLSRTFDTDVKKSFFPYTFVNKGTLFYKGDKPGISFYGIDVNNIVSGDKLLEEKISFYNSIPKKNWSTKEQTFIYLKKDLISLYHVIDKFKYQIYKDYYTHITKSYTISGLAMNIFLRRFYKGSIPLINKKSIYNDIKNSYFGGITEVYKPFGKNLYYYDVNSLYPFAALNPMPGLDCILKTDINKNIEECKDDFFGFYNCTVSTTDAYLGILPVRAKDGLIMPTGEFTGWYFSEELKYAHEHGYKIKVISGYQFNKIDNVFKDYVEHFYNIKCNAKDPVERIISKSLLNNLLGRFGLRIDKSITEIVDRNEFEKILQTKQINSIKYLNNKVLVTHNQEVSPEICEEHGIDFKQAYISDTIGNKSHSDVRLNNVSIPISSAVTSYSRIYMNKVKLDLLKKGASIYYTDTDSIVTDTKLDDQLVSDHEIGKFKLEHKISVGYFISNKTYCFLSKDGKFVSKNKGSVKGSLTLEDFKNLYDGLDISTVRNQSVKDYSTGSVTIKNNLPIKVFPDSYTKREKIYKKNMWIDTKPINIRLYHSNASNKKRLYTLSILSTIVKYIFVLLFTFIFYLFCTLLLGIEYGEVFTGKEEVSIDSSELKKIKSIKKGCINKFSDVNRSFYRTNNIYNPVSNKVNINNSPILNAVIAKHCNDNAINLEKAIEKANFLETQIDAYEKILCNYKELNNKTLEDLNAMSKLIKK